MGIISQGGSKYARVSCDQVFSLSNLESNYEVGGALLRINSEQELETSFVSELVPVQREREVEQGNSGSPVTVDGNNAIGVIYAYLDSPLITKNVQQRKQHYTEYFLTSELVNIILRVIHLPCVYAQINNNEHYITKCRNRPKFTHNCHLFIEPYI